MQDAPLSSYFGARFTTTDDTGANKNADATPTYRVLAPGSDVAVLSGNCRKTAALTGAYEAYFQVLAPCVAGTAYQVVVTAAVDGIENADVEVGVFRAVAAGATPQPTLEQLTSGEGAFVITLTVKQAGVAVQGVPVTLQATAGNNVQTSLADGTVQYNRDAGSWAWVIEDTAGYTGSSGTVVVNSSGVVTSPAGGIITITAIALPVAVNPTGCACYMDMLNADGLTPVGAGLGSLRVAKLIARSAGDTLVWADDKDNDAPRLTNAAGRVSIELPQGRTFILVATWPDGRETTVEFLVPVLASKDVGQYFQPYTAA